MNGRMEWVSVSWNLSPLTYSTKTERFSFCHPAMFSEDLAQVYDFSWQWGRDWSESLFHTFQATVSPKHLIPLLYMRPHNLSWTSRALPKVGGRAWQQHRAPSWHNWCGSGPQSGETEVAQFVDDQGKAKSRERRAESGAALECWEGGTSLSF